MLPTKGDLQILAAMVGLRVNIATGRHVGEAIGLGPEANPPVASKGVDTGLAVESKTDDRRVGRVSRLVSMARQQLGAPGAAYAGGLIFGAMGCCAHASIISWIAAVTRKA